MLDGQMKEAYQLLGLQPPKSIPVSTSTTKLPSDGISYTGYSNEFQNFLSTLTKSSPEQQQQLAIQSGRSNLFQSLGSLSIIPGANNEQSSSSSGSSSSVNNKPISPVITTQRVSNSAPNTIDQLLEVKETRPKNIIPTVASDSSSSAAIKDEFILNQIDLINKYYQIDSKTLVSVSTANLAAASDHVNSSSSETRLMKTMTTLKSPSLNCEEQFENNVAGEKNTSSTSSSRANELKHYIEMLLNRLLLLLLVSIN